MKTLCKFHTFAVVKTTLLNIFYLALLLVPTQALAYNEPESKKKDTVSALVMYGEELLLKDFSQLNNEQVVNLRDSLASLSPSPDSLINQIDLYLDIPNMTFDEVFSVIDSLFEMKEIPYPLINQINWYVAHHEQELNHEKETFDTSQYPAEFYYNEWNTAIPNPYATTKLTQGDSVIQLQLTEASRSNYFVLPIEGVMTSGFGWRDGRNHNGVDIDLQVWDPVKTAFSGMVRVARWYGAYGRVVVVRHYNGLETIYAHLHRLKVKPGQIVEAGDVVGLGGSSGRSTGSHLHWEVRFKGIPLNPHLFIDFEKHELVNPVLVLKKTKFGYAAFPEGAEFHEVKTGDFLYKIAQNYGVSVNQLCRLNGIQRNQYLYVGQKVRVL